MEQIKYFESNPELIDQSRVYMDIPYVIRDGREYKMQIILPWAAEKGKKYPGLLFVQGSAWTTSDVGWEIPQLGRLAGQGYVIATIQHRSSLDGYPYPAFLEDVKSAIRFLKKHAQEYSLESDRIGIWGTSSGGNAALLAGLTMGEEELITEDNREISDEVAFVVSCFGPSDMAEIIAEKNEELSEQLECVTHSETMKLRMKKAEAMSPYYRVKKDQNYPPFFLLHGDADELVPVEQSVKMYQRLKEYGYEAKLAIVKGAEHEGNFWSREVLDEIFSFIKEHR